MGDKKLTYKQKSSLKFVAQDDPPFIKQMKAKLGYRAPATVDDKFVSEEQEEDDDPLHDRDDIRNLPEEERPQIVVLDEKTDVTQAELDKEIAKLREQDEKKKIEEGCIVFKKPEKRTHGKDEKKDETKPKKVSLDRSQNSKLLSFNVDEDEEDDA